MAGSVNKVILVGNLGRDPEVRRMNSGESVVSFSVATSETWRDKASGERKERTEWHNVVIFNENLGKIAEQYLKKGAKVTSRASCRPAKFTDKNGAERQTTEVVLQRFRGELTLLDGRSGGGGAMEDDAGYGGQAGSAGGSRGGDFGRSSPMEQRRPAPAGGGRPAQDLDDDIPF